MTAPAIPNVLDLIPDQMPLAPLNVEEQGFWDGVAEVMRVTLQRVPITTNIDVSVGLSVHDCIVPPAASPAPSPSVELPIPNLTAVSLLLGTAKPAFSVRYRMFGVPLFVMKGASNAGPLIPDITVLNPANPMLPIHAAAASRKIAFDAARVKIEGTGVGLTAIQPLPLPLTTCGNPVSPPTAGTPMNMFLYSAFAGLSVGDFLGGVVAIGLEMAFAFALSKAFPSTGSPKTDALNVVVNRMTSQLTSEKGLMGVLLNGLTGVVRDLIKGKENPTYKVTFDAIIAQQTYEVGLTELRFRADRNVLNRPVARLEVDAEQVSVRRSTLREAARQSWDAEPADGVVHALRWDSLAAEGE